MEKQLEEKKLKVLNKKKAVLMQKLKQQEEEEASMDEGGKMKRCSDRAGKRGDECREQGVTDWEGLMSASQVSGPVIPPPQGLSQLPPFESVHAVFCRRR